MQRVETLDHQVDTLAKTVEKMGKTVETMGSAVALPKRQGRTHNTWRKKQIRPRALGRKNWLFVGSQRSCKRAAAIMIWIQSARLKGHDPYAYLKDVLTRLPT